MMTKCKLYHEALDIYLLQSVRFVQRFINPIDHSNMLFVSRNLHIMLLEIELICVCQSDLNFLSFNSYLIYTQVINDALKLHSNKILKTFIFI